MDSSANLRPRKRKQCSSSDRVNGVFTRSKSRVHVHYSRSGRTWTDTLARKLFDEAHLLLGKRLEKPRNVQCPSPESEASLDLSIKDLRSRARRIFSPTSVVEEETQKFKAGVGFSEEGCNGVSKLVDDCENLDLGIGDSNLGLKDSDMDSDLGFACSGKEECGGSEDVVPVDEDPVLGLEGLRQPDKEEDGVKLNDKTPVMEKKNEGNNVESGKGCSENERNGSISGSKSVLNSSSKRKVFKAPSSFSYRRLLPFLMEMAKDDSSISKFDMVDIDYPCKIQNLNNVDSNLPSALTECCAAKSNHTDDHSDLTKTLDKGDYRNCSVQLPISGQDFYDPTKKIAKTEENIELSDMDQRNNENGMNGVDALIEEFSQTTPLDDTIFNKLDNDNVRPSREFSAAQNGNHVFEKSSIGNNSSNGICISMKPHPAKKTNSISNAKLVLNPCSRSKIFESSSFSYRRLLPFLTDVAKSTAKIDEPPKLQREDDSHSVAKESVDENVPTNRTRTDSFPKNQDPEDEEPFARPVNNLPTTGTSHDTIPDVSTPFFSYGDSLPNENSNTPSSGDSSGNLEIELSANVIKSCHNQNNCSAETSFIGVPKSDVSQVSDHKPTNVAKEYMLLGLDYHKDKLQLLKSVSLCHSSLEIDEFDHQGNPGDSPTNGILKRNPRGCRGLCNCLNCTSFRLHAERSFEFSKNQMLDAEEVAHGLINELEKIRSLLEKSVFGDSDPVAVQINQAKEACERALRTEQLAKDRLSQMNCDLKIHCSIRPLQRPRVTFSGHIEEIAISKTDPSVGNNLQKQEVINMVKPALSKNVLYAYNMPAGIRGVVGSSTGSCESANCS